LALELEIERPKQLTSRNHCPPRPGEHREPGSRPGPAVDKPNGFAPAADEGPCRNRRRRRANSGQGKVSSASMWPNPNKPLNRPPMMNLICAESAQWLLGSTTGWWPQATDGARASGNPTRAGWGAFAWRAFEDGSVAGAWGAAGQPTATQPQWNWLPRWPCLDRSSKQLPLHPDLAAAARDSRSLIRLALGKWMAAGKRKGLAHGFWRSGAEQRTSLEALDRAACRPVPLVHVRGHNPKKSPRGPPRSRQRPLGGRHCQVACAKGGTPPRLATGPAGLQKRHQSRCQSVESSPERPSAQLRGDLWSWRYRLAQRGYAPAPAPSWPQRGGSCPFQA